MMKKKCFQETPESVRLVENLALEWSVRSALRRDPRTAGTSITVGCEGGGVKLAGVVDTQEEANVAGEVAAAVEGVRDLDNRLKPTDTAGSRYRRG